MENNVRVVNNHHAQVDEPSGQWSLSVLASTMILAVYADPGGTDTITLQTRSIDLLVSRWSAIRPLYGVGPLAQDVRDAWAACRRELDLLAQEVA